MSTSSILPAPHGIADRKAPRAASFGARLKRVGLAVWRALEASGQARAMRELRALYGHPDIGDAEFARRVRDGSALLGSSVGSSVGAPHR